MAKRHEVRDAWDDDWETQADQMSKEEKAPVGQTPLSRPELLARHAEGQRRLWESAETPEDNHFVAVNNNIPLATGFKPAMKVLSRKPAPQMIVKKDPVTGLEQLTLQDDDQEDESASKPQLTPEEIRMRQQRELEEKQRRYEEARAKIFGDTNAPSRRSGQSSPRNETPPPMSDGRQANRRQARGRSGQSRAGSRQDSRQDNQNRRTPVGPQGGSSRELYDPNFSPRPGFSIQKRNGGSASPTPRPEDQIIRAPIGPDNSGGVGFKFARRGGAQEG